MTTIDVSTSPKLTGRVKWFNNKAGFGFITVCDYDGEHSGKDIFVHFTSIGVKNNQYKYLVQGEYVDFTLTRLADSNHEFHAVDVCGIKGGSLMCETRKQTSQERSNRAVNDTHETARKEVSVEVRKRTTPRKYAGSKKSDKVEAASGEEDGFKKVVRKRSVRPTKPTNSGNNASGQESSDL